MNERLGIKAIIFDCFGVLYVNSGQLFYEANIPDYSQHKQVLRDLDKQCDYGFITQDQLVAQVAELSGLNKNFVRDNIQGTHIHNDDLLQAAQALRRDYKVGLLSNIGAGSMNQFFTHKERNDYFDNCVLSGDVGIIKPDPAIYTLIANNLGVRTDECVMIDDSLDNCYGADAAGMKWIHYLDTPQCKSELVALLRHAE